MAYFNELPNINVATRMKGAHRSDELIELKNLFKRAKLRTDVDQAITAFEYYQIPDNMRPDVLAKNLYDDPELDWVILVTNNIINVRNEWPLSNNDLHNYILEKHGTTEGVHHYETTEIKDSNGRIVLEKGLYVDSTFTFKWYDGVSLKNEAPVQSVSNYTYESKINDEKRKIKVLKKTFVPMFINDMRKMMKYSKSSQYKNSKLKEGYNPRIVGV